MNKSKGGLIKKPSVSEVAILKQRSSINQSPGQKADGDYASGQIKFSKQSKIYSSLSKGSSQRNAGINNKAGYNTFERAYSTNNVRISTGNKSAINVQKNLKHLTKMRGAHDKWSLKDVPIKLLRKPTNFKFLYNSSAMANYYNDKIALEEQVRNKCKNTNINTSLDNINNLKQILSKSDRKYGIIEQESQKKLTNRSFDFYKPETPKFQRRSNSISSSISTANKSKFLDLKFR